MLSGEFFHIISLQQENGKINAMLTINKTHSIFQGHFPGQPVVPGVCMVQMVKEILQSALAKKTRLENADQIKFLTVIDPTQSKLIDAEINYSLIENGKIRVAASLVSKSVTYFKMNGVFCEEPPCPPKGGSGPC